MLFSSPKAYTPLMDNGPAGPRVHGIGRRKSCFWAMTLASLCLSAGGFGQGAGRRTVPPAVAVTSGAPGRGAERCTEVVLEGELHAGDEYFKPFAGGLAFWMQPIHSGWILRVVPVSGLRDAHDYAELATPPYHSPTPLSLSTDFSFRAQDAAGWNPRRFHFATSLASFQQLLSAYQPFESEGARPDASAQKRLAALIGQTAEGVFTVRDVRLVPGSADQTPAASAVAGRFNATAHTLDLPAPGGDSPLGRLEWVLFRVNLTLPAGFRVERGVATRAAACSR